MKKNSLNKNGLSLSQAQSISNLINQRAVEIENKLKVINNFSKTINISGNPQVIQKAVKMPDNVIELVLEKGKLHACQAFLMENIKAKDTLLLSIKKEVADISSIEVPVRPKLVSPIYGSLQEVDEMFGWEQLSTSEMNEYLEAEAYASHIGQFIHSNSILDKLRKEISNIPDIEWMELKKDEKVPVNIIVHHTSEELLTVHEKLAAEHRKYEQKVNYFKAKVKNLKTTENARIAKLNADLAQKVAVENKEKMAAYEVEINNYNAKVSEIQTKFEIERQNRIKDAAVLRIEVDPRFKELIDSFLNTLPAE